MKRTPHHTHPTMLDCRCTKGFAKSDTHPHTHQGAHQTIHLHQNHHTLKHVVFMKWGCTKVSMWVSVWVSMSQSKIVRKAFTGRLLDLCGWVWWVLFEIYIKKVPRLWAFKKFSTGHDFWKFLHDFCEILMEYFSKLAPFWKHNKKKEGVSRWMTHPLLYL